MSYQLVNPLSNGNKISSKASNPDEGAYNIWSKFNKYTKYSTSNSYFTIQQKGGDLYHYKVSESVDDNKVKFTIERFNDINSKHSDELKQKLNSLEGGKRYRLSSSSSTSSSSSSNDKDNLTFKFKSKNKQKYLKTNPLIIYPPAFTPSYYYSDLIYYNTSMYNVNDLIVLPTLKSNFAQNYVFVPNWNCIGLLCNY